MAIVTTSHLLLLFCIFVIIWMFAGLRKKYYSQYVQQSSSGSVLKPLPGIPLWTAAFMAWGQTRWLHYILKFGRISSFTFGKFRLVSINDFQLGKELFSNPVFCGKEISELFTVHSNGRHGLISSDGQQWRDQRKYIHQSLKEFGFGQKSNETSIRLDIETIIRSWQAQKGQRFSPNKDFYVPVLNSIWIILTGQRAAEDDQLGYLAYKVYEGFAAVFQFPDVLVSVAKISMKNVRRIYTWLPIFSGCKKFDQSMTNLRTYLQNIVRSRKQQLLSTPQDSLPPNFLDNFLAKMDLTTNPKSEFFQNQGEKNLVAIMTEFFIAGGDTTASMLTWSMLHLIRNPDVQEKIQNEIDQVVGMDQIPCLDHRKNCPYTDAFILEALRVTPIAAVSMPHSPTENTCIGPYFIEKGTVMCLNIFGIHHDPKIWGDPHQFRPQRFLSEDGKALAKSEAMCAFSLGPRRCIGEQTARDMLFLFVSAICQRFTLKPDPLLQSKRQPLCSGKSMVYSPTKFHMIAIDRRE